MQLGRSLFFVGVITALAIPAFAGSLHSSIQVPGGNKKASEAKEEINTPRLLKLCKINKEEAKAIAAKKYKGKFGKIDLENEDGDLIWSVEIGTKELAIDAGNGKILQIE